MPFAEGEVMEREQVQAKVKGEPKGSEEPEASMVTSQACGACTGAARTTCGGGASFTKISKSASAAGNKAPVAVVRARTSYLPIPGSPEIGRRSRVPVTLATVTQAPLTSEAGLQDHDNAGLEDAQV